MKSLFLVAMFVSAIGAAFTFAGCAEQQTTTAAANPTDRTYTSSDLERSGRHDTATAAQAVDPDVRVSGGR